MTEDEWLTCSDPQPMLEHLSDNTCYRKSRLFAVACCRRVWDLLREQRSRNAIEVAERYADSLATEQQLKDASAAFGERRGGDDSWHRDSFAAGTETPANAAAWAVTWIGLGEKEVSDAAAAAASSTWADRKHEFKIHADLLRDIFGNPFRPVHINTNWLAPNVVSLAQAIYDERAFGRLLELAEALVDAGCDDQDILSHCRSDGPHVRGCWVVDLVLGWV